MVLTPTQALVLSEEEQGVVSHWSRTIDDTLKSTISGSIREAVVRIPHSVSERVVSTLTTQYQQAGWVAEWGLYGSAKNHDYALTISLREDIT